VTEWFEAKQVAEIVVEARGPVEETTRTANGLAEPGEYVLKDPDGETYPCSSKTFHDRYEVIDDGE